MRRFLYYHAEKPESPDEILTALAKYGSSTTRLIDVNEVEKTLLRLHKRGLVESSDGGKTWLKGPNQHPHISEDNTYMLIELTALDIRNMETVASHMARRVVDNPQNPETDWNTLHEILRPGIVAVPGRFAKEFLLIADELFQEGDEHLTKPDDESDLRFGRRLMRLMARLDVARCPSPPKNVNDPWWLGILREEWNRRPRTRAEKYAEEQLEGPSCANEKDGGSKQ